MTTPALLLLIFLLAWFLVDLVADFLNLRALPATPPPEATEIYEPAAYQRLLDYTRADTRLEIVASTTRLAALLVFWLGGGFGWLDEVVRSLANGPVSRGLLFIGALWLGGRLLSLPFHIWATFGVETRFGFNRTTPALLAADELKSALLTAVLGGALCAVLISFFETAGPHAWLLAWAFAAAALLLLVYVAPSLILPWFNKFTPLPPGELHDAILHMARSHGFPVGGVFTMDGSKRSTRSNAFFTGFGRTKKIALYDTLIERHPVSEILAILAHEIGHFKLHHIPMRIALSLLGMGLFLFVASRLLHAPALFAAFGIGEPSVYAGLALLAIFSEPLARLLALASNALSRQHEFAADAFAARATGGPAPLMSALKKLARDNLVNLAPHPLFVWLHHSHPPLFERLASLEKQPAFTNLR